jgi:hypothetical protein
VPLRKQWRSFFEALEQLGGLASLEGAP